MPGRRWLGDDLMSVEAGPLGNHGHLQMSCLCSVHSSGAVIQNVIVNSTIKSKGRERSYTSTICSLQFF